MVGVEIRTAGPDDLPAVMGVLDGALLETDAEAIRERIEDGAVSVAVTDRDTVVGALVLEGPEITAVAVRRSRRGQGVGTELVRAALAREGRLVAAFDDRVRPFYEDLGFAIEPLRRGHDTEDRYVGVRWD